MWKTVLNWRHRRRENRKLKEKEKMKKERVAKINEKYGKNFDYRIGDFIAMTDKTVVMLDIPRNEGSIDNIYAVDGGGGILWRSESLRKLYPEEIKILPYIYLSMADGYITGVDFSGIRYFINPDNGHIEKTDFVK